MARSDIRLLAGPFFCLPFCLFLMLGFNGQDVPGHLHHGHFKAKHLRWQDHFLVRLLEITTPGWSPSANHRRQPTLEKLIEKRIHLIPEKPGRVGGSTSVFLSLDAWGQ